MSEDVTNPVETLPHPVAAPDASHGPEVAPDHVAEPAHDNGHPLSEPEPAHGHDSAVVAHEQEAPALHASEPQRQDLVTEAPEAEDQGPDLDEEAEPEAEPEPEPEEEPRASKHWYVVKVQSGREDTIKDAIERRVRKEGLEEFFGQIVIPVEKVTEVKVDKNGKRVPKTKERKLYPGYLMVEVAYNDRIVYLFRETSGVGDFVGAHPGDLMKPPTPMSEREVQRMLGPTMKPGDVRGGAPPIAPPPKWLQPGDRVRVVDGTFNGMDGSVKQILEAVSKVQVELSIFGRPVAVDFEYYQVEQA